MGKRPAIGQIWRNAWEHVVPFFAFAPSIRNDLHHQMRSRRCTAACARSSRPAAASRPTRRHSSYCISPSRTPGFIGGGRSNGLTPWGSSPSTSVCGFQEPPLMRTIDITAKQSGRHAVDDTSQYLKHQLQPSQKSLTQNIGHSRDGKWSGNRDRNTPTRHYAS